MRAFKKVIGLGIVLLFQLSLMITAAAWDGESVVSNVDGIYSFMNGGTLVWTTDPGVQKMESFAPRHPIPTIIPTGAGTINTNRKTGDELDGFHKEAGENEFIYIKKWVCAEGTPNLCIHNSNPILGWHGLQLNHGICSKYYTLRWTAYCADCDKKITLLVTGTKATLEKLYKIKNGSDYYYLCPLDEYKNEKEGHMEQGAPYTHVCEWHFEPNRYLVQYNINRPQNTTIYKNELTEPKAGYVYNGLNNGVSVLESGTNVACIGYKFVGWYTAPVGGTKVETWAELQAQTPKSIININNSTIDVYAHWEECNGYLTLDDECTPTNKVQKVGYNDSYTVPDGVGSVYSITLNANGGSVAVTTITATRKFDYWLKVAPFNAAYNEKTHIFHNNYEVNGATFTLKAIYEPAEKSL